ncbi:Intraflagellar transport protein 57 -like protein [Sarcoptes scabiei]|uniref:Intraflagellar transport protein 57 -like protein n=1 Tax=Sarcoptes scabiei TaxID=52283 RepID=A0A834RHM6_SARSC|nr:Intraflagellar transport protein 57 -like protein [Sarcoptes scabiei]
MATVDQDYSIFRKMCDLHDKLLLIDYRKEFPSNYKCPPLSRYYFCRPINQAQQFFTFCSLCSYLLEKLDRIQTETASLNDDDVNGKRKLKIDAFEDPNLNIEKILHAIKPYVDVSAFSSDRSKLKQGFGIEIIDLLTCLIDKYCFESFSRQRETDTTIKIVHRRNNGEIIDSNNGEEDDDDEDIVDDDYEKIDETEDNEIELYDDGDLYPDSIVHDDWYHQDHYELNPISTNDDQERSKLSNTDMIKSSVKDLTDWKMELERILPRMHSSFLNSNPKMNLISSSTSTSAPFSIDNEWRIHLKALDHQNQSFTDLFTETNDRLRTITKQSLDGLEKIKSKELFLHQNANTILDEWLNVRERAWMIRKSMESFEKEFQRKTKQLEDLNEEDKITKRSIENCSLKMTDSSPLVEAKKSREHLRNELIRVDLQIGVAIQTLVKHVTMNFSYL